MAEIDDLRTQVAALEATVSSAAGVVGAFDAELGRMRESLLFTGREVDRLSAGLGAGLRRAFDGVVFDGMRLSDALKGLGQSIANTVYGIAIKPVQGALGDALAKGINGLLSGGLGFAGGGAFTQGRVMPFAQGGIVSSPTMFRCAAGAG